MRPIEIDETRSVWDEDLPPRLPARPLEGSIAADLAIVGGGFTGISTAWHVSRRFPDRRIVLLEAGRIGSGASGRNGGQILNWIGGVRDADPEAARRTYELTRSGIDLIEQLAREHAPDARFTRNGSLEVFTDPRRAEEAQRRAESLAGAGVPLRWLGREELGARGSCGAVLDPTAGQANGLALLRGLRPVLEGRGVAVHEETPVLRVEEGTSIRLATPRGGVRAAAVVLATNAYTPALGYFREGILPLHSHVVATEILPPDAWDAIGWGSADGFSDDLDRIAFGCRTGSGRLVFGGGSNAAYAYRFGGGTRLARSHAARTRPAAAIRGTLLGYFPTLAGVRWTHHWAGALALTFDRAPTMGVRGDAKNVLYALGYSGHGFVLAMLAGRVLCDLYSGEHDPWRGYPFYQRRLPRIPPEPLRWLGYQLYTRLTGRSPRRTS
jgi:glycine/D-amino acid oxidase-like deaminating enzyme